MKHFRPYNLSFSLKPQRLAYVDNTMQTHEKTLNDYQSQMNKEKNGGAKASYTLQDVDTLRKNINTIFEKSLNGDTLNKKMEEVEKKLKPLEEFLVAKKAIETKASSGLAKSTALGLSSDVLPKIDSNRRNKAQAEVEQWIRDNIHDFAGDDFLHSGEIGYDIYQNRQNTNPLYAVVKGFLMSAYLTLDETRYNDLLDHINGIYKQNGIFGLKHLDQIQLHKNNSATFKWATSGYKTDDAYDGFSQGGDGHWLNNVMSDGYAFKSSELRGFLAGYLMDAEKMSIDMDSSEEHKDDFYYAYKAYVTSFLQKNANELKKMEGYGTLDESIVADKANNVWVTDSQLSQIDRFNKTLTAQRNFLLQNLATPDEWKAALVETIKEDEKRNTPAPTEPAPPPATNTAPAENNDRKKLEDGYEYFFIKDPNFCNQYIVFHSIYSKTNWKNNFSEFPSGTPANKRILNIINAMNIAFMGKDDNIFNVAKTAFYNFFSQYLSDTAPILKSRLDIVLTKNSLNQSDPVIVKEIELLNRVIKMNTIIPTADITPIIDIASAFDVLKDLEKKASITPSQPVGGPGAAPGTPGVPLAPGSGGSAPSSPSPSVPGSTPRAAGPESNARKPLSLDDMKKDLDKYCPVDKATGKVTFNPQFPEAEKKIYMHDRFSPADGKFLLVIKPGGTTRTAQFVEGAGKYEYDVAGNAEERRVALRNGDVVLQGTDLADIQKKYAEVLKGHPNWQVNLRRSQPDTNVTTNNVTAAPVSTEQPGQPDEVLRRRMDVNAPEELITTYKNKLVSREEFKKVLLHFDALARSTPGFNNTIIDFGNVKLHWARWRNYPENKGFYQENFEKVLKNMPETVAAKEPEKSSESAPEAGKELEKHLHEREVKFYKSVDEMKNSKLPDEEFMVESYNLVAEAVEHMDALGTEVQKIFEKNKDLGQIVLAPKNGEKITILRADDAKTMIQKFLFIFSGKNAVSKPGLRFGQIQLKNTGKDYLELYKKKYPAKVQKILEIDKKWDAALMT